MFPNAKHTLITVHFIYIAALSSVPFVFNCRTLTCSHDYFVLCSSNYCSLVFVFLFSGSWSCVISLNKLNWRSWVRVRVTHMQQDKPTSLLEPVSHFRTASVGRSLITSCGLQWFESMTSLLIKTNNSVLPAAAAGGTHSSLVRSTNIDERQEICQALLPDLILFVFFSPSVWLQAKKHCSDKTGLGMRHWADEGLHITLSWGKQTDWTERHTLLSSVTRRARRRRVCKTLTATLLATNPNETRKALFGRINAHACLQLSIVPSVTPDPFAEQWLLKCCLSHNFSPWNCWQWREVGRTSFVLKCKFCKARGPGWFHWRVNWVQLWQFNLKNMWGNMVFCILLV